MNAHRSHLIITVVAVVTLALLAVVAIGVSRRGAELHASADASQYALQQQLPGSYGTMLNTLNTVGWR